MIKNMFLVLCSIMFLSCNTDLVLYEISDDYIGPCVVFISFNNKTEIDSNRVVVKDGLGMINNINMKKKFIFKSIEKQNEIKIVQVGKEGNIVDTNRYIFRLTKGNTTSSCVKGELGTVSFFVGKKSDFAKWSDKYYSELVFFDSIGVDWCRYYKTYN